MKTYTMVRAIEPANTMSPYGISSRKRLTLRLTYRRRGGWWSAEKMMEWHWIRDRKALAAVRCRRSVRKSHLVNATKSVYAIITPKDTTATALRLTMID